MLRTEGQAVGLCQLFPVTSFCQNMYNYFLLNKASGLLAAVKLLISQTCAYPLVGDI
jgi:hypothetical protein